MGDQVVVARRPLRGGGGTDGAIDGAGSQHRPGNHHARGADAVVGGIDRVTTLRNPIGIETNVGQQPSIRHGKERRFVIRGGVDDKNIRLILRDPVLIVGHQHVTIGGAGFVDGKAGAFGQVQGIHGDRFEGVDDGDIIKRTIRPLSNPGHFLQVLGVAFFDKRDIFAGLNDGAFPGELQMGIGRVDQEMGALYTVLDQRPAGFANLLPHLPVGAGYPHKGRWILVEDRFVLFHTLTIDQVVTFAKWGRQQMTCFKPILVGARHRHSPAPHLHSLDLPAPTLCTCIS